MTAETKEHSSTRGFRTMWTITRRLQSTPLPWQGKYGGFFCTWAPLTSNQEKLQEELNELRRHLENLSSKPNILHRLLCEEIELSFLFLRHTDTIYARHYSNLSSLALRRMDTAQIRFLRALKTLANMQKLPQFLNVNLGTQQIAMTS